MNSNRSFIVEKYPGKHALQKRNGAPKSYLNQHHPAPPPRAKWKPRVGWAGKFECHFGEVLEPKLASVFIASLFGGGGDGLGVKERLSINPQYSILIKYIDIT